MTLFFFSSSHFLTLQIWCATFLLMQLLQVPQFSVRMQGPHMPHLFLFFRTGSCDMEKSPACWCSVWMYWLRGDTMLAPPDLRNTLASSSSKENSCMFGAGGTSPSWGLCMLGIILFSSLGSVVSGVQGIENNTGVSPQHRGVHTVSSEGVSLWV